VIVWRILEATQSKPAVKTAFVEFYFSGGVVRQSEKISVKDEAITLRTDPSGGC
jgi:hypothetical protein